MIENCQMGTCNFFLKRSFYLFKHCGVDFGDGGGCGGAYLNWTCTDSVVGTVGSKVVAARHAGDIEDIRGGNYSSSFDDGCRE